MALSASNKKQNNFVSSLRTLETSWALSNQGLLLWLFSSIPSVPSKVVSGFAEASCIPVIMPCQSDIMFLKKSSLRSKSPLSPSESHFCSISAQH